MRACSWLIIPFLAADLFAAPLRAQPKRITSLTLGPGGTGTFDWQINDAGPLPSYPSAPGVAGPLPNANNLVSGWSLIISEVFVNPITHVTSSGNFNWSADSVAGDQFDFQLETLVGQYTSAAGPPTDGAMLDFDPTQHYVWPFAAWQGTFTGPTSSPVLTADTLIDTSLFANPIPTGSKFSIVYNGSPLVLSDGTTFAGSLELVYTPAPVPEPGTLGLVGIGALVVLRRAIRRRR